MNENHFWAVLERDCLIASGYNNKLVFRNKQTAIDNYNRLMQHSCNKKEDFKIVKLQVIEDFD